MQSTDKIGVKQLIEINMINVWRWRSHTCEIEGKKRNGEEHLIVVLRSRDFGCVKKSTWIAQIRLRDSHDYISSVRLLRGVILRLFCYPVI